MVNIKPKTCKVCRKKYKPWSTTQQVCGTPCAIILSDRQRASKAKQQRKADRLKKESLRPRSWYLKKAQAAFNVYVQKRDEKDPCISCQRHHTGQYHAGHFLTTGARPELRYHPSNNNKQCSACNNHLSGNIVLYRKHLLKKIGAEMVDYLENFNVPQRWTVEELNEIAQHYKDELKHLKAGE